MAAALITYQDLLNAKSRFGLPLAYFAKACNTANIKNWKVRGIPAQFQEVLNNIFSRKIKELQNSEKAANETARLSPLSPKKINHLAPQAGLNSMLNLGKLPNNPNTLLNNNLAWLDLPQYSDDEMDRLELRFQKYIRQNAARHLLPEKRVHNCLRDKTRIDVSLMRVPGGSSYFQDLFVCGSLWACPVCSAKISEKRRAEGLLATQQHRDQFGKNSILFITFTYPHHREDVLADLLDKQRRAFKWLKDDCWDYRRFCEKYKYVGDIRALEVTHGDMNGWHPHVHFLFFFERDFDFEHDDNGFGINKTTGIEPIKKELYDLWQRACSVVGLGEPSWEHGVDVQDGAYAAEYMLKFGLEDERGLELAARERSRSLVVEDKREVILTKWGMEDEVFKSGVKGREDVEGKKSRTPFQLLDEFIEGDKYHGKLFIEYVHAFHGFRQSRWSKGLKARFNLADVSDEQAAIGEERGYLFAQISGSDWSIMEKKGRFTKDIRPVLLMLSDLGDSLKFWAYVAWVCGRDISEYKNELLAKDKDAIQGQIFEIDASLLEPEFIEPEIKPIAEVVLPELHFKQTNMFSFDESRAVSPLVGLSPAQILKEVFGYDDFRGNQADVVEHVTAGGSGLVLMPTGGGKSLCYQIPMLARSGLGVVISPLIALMQDQVNALRAKGVRAVFINSSLGSGKTLERRIFAIEQQILNGEVDILYISPERLNLPSTLKFLAACEISLFAVDEAHCISQWGHDFRSDYLAVSVIQKHFPHVPRLALTATADSNTRSDIIRLVGLENAKLFTASFDRPNIDYTVLKSSSAEQTKRLCLDFVQRHQGQTGIIYCSSIEKINKLVELLVESGIDALPYHSRITPKQKRANLESFLERPVVMVATTAFGMGIDKADVRYVLHVDLSDSIEGFYQESGRAGRDGLPAKSVVIYNKSSTDYRIKHKTESQQHKFEFMRKYCELDTCRRSYLLNFFV